MPTIITAARLVTPVEWIEAPVVVIEDGHIASLASRNATEIPVRQLRIFGLDSGSRIYRYPYTRRRGDRRGRVRPDAN